MRSADITLTEQPPCQYCGKPIVGRHLPWSLNLTNGERVWPLHRGCGPKYDREYHKARRPERPASYVVEEFR